MPKSVVVAVRYRLFIAINIGDSRSKQLEPPVPPFNINIAVIRKLDNAMVQLNYLQIKQDIHDISHSEMEKLLNGPALAYLMIKK